MSGLRSVGGLGINHLTKGAWAKYANIDFGTGQATTAEFGLEPIGEAKAFAELHLDAPDGQRIGTLMAGQKTCPVQKVRGIHNLFLVFPDSSDRLLDWFRFQTTSASFNIKD